MSRVTNIRRVDDTSELGSIDFPGPQTTPQPKPDCGLFQAVAA